MTDCERFLPELKAYLDGELPVFLRRRVQKHLRRCSSCREEIKLMEKITAELSQSESAVLEPSLRDKLLAGVPSTPNHPTTKPSFKARWQGTRRKPLLLWSTAAATLLVWFVVAPMFNPAKQGVESSPASVASIATKMSAPISPEGNAVSDMESKRINGKDGNEVATDSNSSGGAGGGGLGGGRATRAQKMAPSKENSGLPSANATLMSPAHVTASSRAVHRTASLTVEVKSAESASEAVETMVRETKGGYIAANELSTNDDGTKRATLTIKVPVNDFDSFLGRLAKQGVVKSKSITGEDVTEKTSDSSQEKRSLNEQLYDASQKLQAARNRQQKSDASQEIRDLKVQIAETEGRLDLLHKMARLADITLELHEKPKDAPIVKTGGFVDHIKETAVAAQENFVIAARIPVIVLVWVVVYSPLWLLILFSYRFITRRYYQTPNS